MHTPWDELHDLLRSGVLESIVFSTFMRTFFSVQLLSLYFFTNISTVYVDFDMP